LFPGRPDIQPHIDFHAEGGNRAYRRENGVSNCLEI
jgi:hypothetical protein